MPLSEVVDKNCTFLCWRLYPYGFPRRVVDGSQSTTVLGPIKYNRIKNRIVTCGSKATMVIRLNAQGIPVKEGRTIE